MVGLHGINQWHGTTGTRSEVSIIARVCSCKCRSMYARLIHIPTRPPLKPIVWSALISSGPLPLIRRHESLSSLLDCGFRRHDESLPMTYVRTSISSYVHSTKQLRSHGVFFLHVISSMDRLTSIDQVMYPWGNIQSILLLALQEREAGS